MWVTYIYRTRIQDCGGSKTKMDNVINKSASNLLLNIKCTYFMGDLYKFNFVSPCPSPKFSPIYPYVL